MEEKYKQEAWENPDWENVTERRSYLNGFRDLLDNLETVTVSELEALS